MLRNPHAGPEGRPRGLESVRCVMFVWVAVKELILSYDITGI